jgi:hypothetical protein
MDNFTKTTQHVIQLIKEQHCNEHIAETVGCSKYVVQLVRDWLIKEDILSKDREYEENVDIH